MRVKIRSVMAHPEYGCFQPGEIADLPDAYARILLDAGAADPVDGEPSMPVMGPSEPESAMLAGPSEQAMMPAARAKKSK